MTTPLPSPLLAGPGAGVPDAPAAALDEWFDVGALRRNRRYRRGTWAIGSAGMLTGAAWTVAVALTGRRWRPVVSRIAARRPAPAAAVFGVALAVSRELISLPAGTVAYGWGRAHGLVTQPVRGWLGDKAKAAGLGAGLAGGLSVAAAALMRRRPGSWWLATWGVTSIGAIVLSAVAPKLIEPLFQSTRPLDDPELERDIRSIAADLAVPVRQVVVNDASTRTTGSNAYVSGLGPTRRVVLFDTLLRDFPREQVRFVVAHELAHVSRRHILRGSLLSSALSLPCFAAIGSVVAGVTGGRRVGRRDADLVLRRLTVASVVAGAAGLVAGRVAMRVSRGFEREADWEALRVTADPDAAIGLQKGMVERNLSVPDPPGWVQRLWGSHPTALERIGLAERARG